MSDRPHVKYREKIPSSDFATTLTRRVDAYFEESGLSRHANGEMIFKGCLAVFLWMLTYAVLMTDRFAPAGVVVLFVLHGFAQLFMTYVIAHDANHGAYSSRGRTNRILSCVFDLVGVNSYMWRLLHNTSHHSFVNIEGADTAVSAHGILRFNPHEKRRPIHRYQHIYASFLYALSTLDWVLAKDYRFFRYKRFGNKTIIRHPRKEIVFLILTKAFYYTYMLVLPILFLSVAWYWVVIGFVVMHLFIGFHIALIFQPTHITEETSFPHPDDDGYISNNYVKHVFETTADFSRRNPFANWSLGCLNLHVIHHMFPKICHVHYPALTEIIRATAAEFGLRYRENRTTAGAFRKHLRLLKTLGQVDDPFGGHAEQLEGR